MIQTSEGGYVVTTSTKSFGVGGQDVLIMRLDVAGNLVWNQTWGNSDRDDISSIVQTNDGGFIVTGDTVTASGWYAWVLKLDDSGNVQWQKTYTTPSGINSILATSDGGYITAGNFLAQGRGFDGWVMKLNGQGDIQWQKTYGGSQYDLFNSIIATGNGNYMVSGYSSSFSAGEWDVWVLALDGSGNILWQKVYGGSADSVAYPLVRSSDGAYFVAGFSNTIGAGDYDAWILKMDGNGNVAGSCAIAANSTGTAINSGAVVTPVISTQGTSSPIISDSSASESDSYAQMSGQCNSVSTTTTLTSEPNPSTYNQTVIFKATVAPVPAGGTVTFKDNGVNISGCIAQTLDESGQANCSTSTFTVGYHPVVAVYNGYSNNNSSTGTLVGGQTVDPAKAEAAIRTEIYDADHNVIASIPIGSSVHAMATAAGDAGTPTGSVTFTLFATTMDCTGPSTTEVVDLNAGVAESNIITAPATGLSYQASYSGDASYIPATSECEPLATFIPVPTITTIFTCRGSCRHNRCYHGCELYRRNSGKV